MTKEQAAAFIAQISAMRPYVPPMIFDALAGSDVGRALMAVANGAATFELRPVDPPKKP